MSGSRRSSGLRASRFGLRVAVAGALIALAAPARAAEVDLGPVASYGEDVRAATIAVSAKGRVSLAVARKDALELVDWTKAAGPQKRWSTEGRFAAEGEDRPHVGFHGEKPWLVALKARRDAHGIVLFRPEEMRSELLTAEGEPECVVAGGNARGDLIVAWTQEGALHGLRIGTDSAGAPVRWTGRIERRVCPCCRPGISVGAPGDVAIAYRDEADGDVRDIRWMIPPLYQHGLHIEGPVSSERWTSKACPMQGPTIAYLAPAELVVAYVVPGPEPRLKVARSREGGPEGLAFGPPVEIAAGEKPQLAMLGAGRVLLAWDGAPDGVFVALSEDAGATWGAPARVDAQEGGVESSGVAVAAGPDGASAWVSWIDKTKDGKRRVSARKVAVKEKE